MTMRVCRFGNSSTSRIRRIAVIGYATASSEDPGQLSLHRDRQNFPCGRYGPQIRAKHPALRCKGNAIGVLDASATSCVVATGCQFIRAAEEITARSSVPGTQTLTIVSAIES